MRTLHAYFGRELLKTLLMTLAALTLLTVMGGGVANIFRGEGVGAEELGKIILYLVPVVVTLILPVAALFSATITYGRAANDNEILACRAAGINIHFLLLTPLALGVMVTIFTYFSWNYMIPYFSRQIEEISRRDLPTIVVGQLQKSRPLSYGKYRITAKNFNELPVEDLGPEYEDHTVLALSGVSFLELENQELIRLGTAVNTFIDFDNSDGTPRVTVNMRDVRSWDASRHQYMELEDQTLGPFTIPLPIKRKIKFETLDTLLSFRKDPTQIREIKELMIGMQRVMQVFLLNQELRDNMSETGTQVLVNEDFETTITAGKMHVDPEDGRITLGAIGARVVYTDGSPTQVYKADQALVEIRSGMRGYMMIIVELSGNVELSREPMGPGDRVIRKQKETLPKVEFRHQPELMKAYDEFDMNILMDEDVPLPLHNKQQRSRAHLIKRLKRYSSEVVGEIHFRASYSLEAIAIILIGAILGIVVRGGQVLTAFGISSIPMLVVVVGSIVGRNLADQPEYETVSVMVMWGATGFMYLAVIFLGTKVLKR